MTERDKSRYTEGSVNIGGCFPKSIAPRILIKDTVRACAADRSGAGQGGLRLKRTLITARRYRRRMRTRDIGINFNERSARAHLLPPVVGAENIAANKENCGDRSFAFFICDFEVQTRYGEEKGRFITSSLYEVEYGKEIELGDIFADRELEKS
ncbi:hypothetical protein EVAR_67178_1 [Eumeta japonica]|uniref:Uncharacterized protein n=1 Tax=Eumeta variegata TaxID=151549 RepID=A0A4C1ZXP8_EUMVA|nr:hypothetical protein EVAR_67178_1 [Eumeta japonica]